MATTFTVLTLLLVSCLSVNAIYVPVTGQSLLDLGKKVGEELSKEILTGLESADVSIKAVQPAIESCLSSIESRQIECATCINTGCQNRATTLQCPDNVVAVSPDTLFTDYQSIKSIVAKSRATVELIASKIKYIVEKVIGAVKKLVEQGTGAVQEVITDGINAVKDGAQQAGSGIKTAVETVKTVAEKSFQEAVSGVKKTVESVQNVAENVAKEVGNAAKNIVNEAENIGQKIGDKVEDAGQAIAKTAEKVVNTVKDIIESIGRRKRLVIEPTCDMFSRDIDTCLFYRDICQTCEVFGANGVQANLLEVITGVCGADLPVSYETLVGVLTKVDGMATIVENFVLTAVNFNPAAVLNGGYQDVQLEFKDTLQNFTMTVSQPVLPFNAESAGPVIAKEIFKQLFTS